MHNSQTRGNLVGGLQLFQRAHWPLLAVIISLSLGGNVARSQQPQPDQQSQPPPAATENQRSDRENGSAQVGSPASSQAADEKSGHDEESSGDKDWSKIFFDHLPDWFVALFTFVLAVFTALLWHSTNKLWLAGEKQMKLIEANAAQQSVDMQASIKIAEDAARAANRSAKLAEDTLSDGQDTARKELRAYLTVVPDGINQLIGRSDVMGHVLLKNVGRLPARNVTLLVVMERSKNPEPEPFLRNQKFDLPRVVTNADRVIQPGCEMRQGSEKPTIPIAELVFPDHNVYVYGIVKYDDGYGRQCFTKFCHRYATASRDRTVKPNSRPTKSRPLIGADKARYHNYGNSAEPPEQ